jgi:hypothetical protein
VSQPHTATPRITTPREILNTFTQRKTIIMIKLNDNIRASIQVLGEDQLDQVVGGCHHKGWGKRHGGGYGRGHGGYGGGRRDDDKSGYGGGSYEEPRDDYGYGSDDSSGSFKVNNQVIDLDITINQVAV